MQTERLHGGQFAVNFNLRLLTDGEVKIADFVRKKQHPLDDGRQIEEAHAEGFSNLGREVDRGSD